MSISLKDRLFNKIHFTGILGSGMSSIAQFLKWHDLEITGSDRLADKTKHNPVFYKLKNMGCTIFPQDGSGLDNSTNALCISTAIEPDNPDLQKAKQLNIPVLHRSELLARIVENHKTIAVAGTSGKSTVTALIFELLYLSNRSPSLISGAALKRLEHEGLIGNAYRGHSDILVIEADESDGTLVNYNPWISLILNVSKDHKPVSDVVALFKKLSSQSHCCIVNADDSMLGSVNSSLTFGLNHGADFFPEKVKYLPLSSQTHIAGREYHLPLPGQHNVSNLLAALCVCSYMKCPQEDLQKATSQFMGVNRRFSITNTASGVTVVDDFAHNPEKIKAAVSAARNISSRLFVLYQPHGFGPTEFLKHEYADTFKSALRQNDHLLLLPIYYAGGSAVMSIRSNDIIDLMGPVCYTAIAPSGRESALCHLKENAKDGDCILLMGARDPSLSMYAQEIMLAFGGPANSPS